MAPQIYTLEELRNKSQVFQDRFDAGKILAGMLQGQYKSRDDVIALAIPSGGVPVGLEVSKRLGCPMDLIIVRKIPLPDNPEASYGAVTLEGNVYLNEALVSRLNLEGSRTEQQIAHVKKELVDRNRTFRQNRSFPSLSGKTTILIDDGLASGYTMIASIHQARAKAAQEVVVAVPTAPLRTIERIEPLVDELYCPNIRRCVYFAVADAYRKWYDLSNREVLTLLGS